MSAVGWLVSVLLLPFAALGLVIKNLFSQTCCCQKTIVGIFSYADPEEYNWITRGLGSRQYNDIIVRPVLLSVRNREDFTEEAQRCHCAILYHTKNRGRINITNVEDSLYDEEIRYLAECRGKSNVIVVVDDLQKSDNEVKLSILNSQPDIRAYAKDLLLFCGEDKRRQEIIEDNLHKIRASLTSGSWSLAQLCSYLTSMTCWVFRHGISWRMQRDLYDPLLMDY